MKRRILKTDQVIVIAASVLILILTARRRMSMIIKVSIFPTKVLVYIYILVTFVIGKTSNCISGDFPASTNPEIQILDTARDSKIDDVFLERIRNRC